MKVLKLDMDFKPPTEWLNLWITSRLGLLRTLGHEAEDWRFFNTKRGMHFYFTLKLPVDDETANMLQFLLGDDHTRVKINAWRIARGIKRWNKLFHKVIFRKKARTIECWYCGNKIPVWGDNVKKD